MLGLCGGVGLDGLSYRGNGANCGSYRSETGKSTTPDSPDSLTLFG